MAKKALSRKIAEQKGLDTVAGPIQRPLRRLLERAPRLGNLLHGTWLGHPLHAALTDLPVGAFGVTFLIDNLERFGGRKKKPLQRVADTALTIGLGGALLAALPGAADWSTIDGKARRVGMIHGLANLVIAGLYGGSLLARRRRHRNLGVGLSHAGYALLIFSSWLGGELSYGYGVGVDRSVREEERPIEERGRAYQVEIEQVEIEGEYVSPAE